MQKKLILFVIICQLFSLRALAQNADIIYLNNGNTVKGKVVSETINYIRIALSNGDTLQYTKQEVRQVDKNTTTIRKPEVPENSYRDLNAKDKGWWCSAELSGGGTLLFKTHNMGFLSVAFINGYRFNEFIKIGVGIDIRAYLANKNLRYKKNPWSFPVYVNARGNILSQKSRMCVPYWSFDAGFCIADGFFFSPTLGARIGENRNALLLGVGFLGQSLQDSPNTHNFYGFLVGRIAYEF